MPDMANVPISRAPSAAASRGVQDAHGVLPALEALQRPAWATGVVATVPPARPQLTDLPQLALQRVVLLLDDASRRHLRCAARRCCAAVDSCRRRLKLPLCALRALDAEVLAARFPAAGCLCVSRPARPVSFALLGRRRRAEQRLAVFLDNPAPGWRSLVALDLCCAVGSVSAATVELLAEGTLAGQLRHLGLPPVAAAPGAVLRLLARLPQLQSCELDCSLFDLAGGRGGQRPRPSGEHEQAPLPQGSAPAPQQHQQLRQRQEQGGVQWRGQPVAAGGPAAGSASARRLGGLHLSAAGQQLCSGAGNPWDELASLQQLQQLQLSRPCGIPALLAVLRRLQGLRSLSLARVRVGESSRGLLDPGPQGLGQLQCLTGLTRLELGLEQPCRLLCCSGGGGGAPQLATPRHLPADAASGAAAGSGRPPAAAATLEHGTCVFASCCFSPLAALRTLVLPGLRIDSALLAATAECRQLSELRVGGLQLRQELAPGPGARGVLPELRVLAVAHAFSLGNNSASRLFPALELLAVQDRDECPDLSCLARHPTLAALALCAGPGWSLASLELGHLVHLPRLRQLTLATDGSHHGSHGHAAHPHPHMGRGLTLASCSSHWLPHASLPQVESLTLAGSGATNDATLSQLPSLFPSVVSLALLGSYYASDCGLKRLCKAPRLERVLIERCAHVTPYGLELLMRGCCSMRLLAVHGCSGVDERACQRIRRACRNTCGCLQWQGSSSGWQCGDLDPLSGLAGAPGLRAAGVAEGDCPGFVERCWREAEAALHA